VPGLTAPPHTTLVHGEILDLVQRAQPLAARFQQRLAQHPLRDALIVTDLEIESDTSFRKRRARDPGTRVRDAEIGRGGVSARGDAAMRERGLSRGERGGWREAWLNARREEDFTRSHRPPEQPCERVQRERNPGEAGTRSGAVRAERETPRVREPRGEGARRWLWPLTAEVGLI